MNWWELNLLSRARKVSRARVDSSGGGRVSRGESDWIEDSFGIWKQVVWGVEYQEKLRGEWER